MIETYVTISGMCSSLAGHVSNLKRNRNMGKKAGPCPGQCWKLTAHCSLQMVGLQKGVRENHNQALAKLREPSGREEGGRGDQDHDGEIYRYS